MAQHSSGFEVGSIVKWGLLLGGGYFAYRAITGASSTAAAPATGSLSLADLMAAIKGAQGSPAPAGTTPAADVKPTEPAPADMIAKLKAAAAAAGDTAATLDQHQWNFYRNKLWPPDFSGAQWSSAFPSSASEQLTAEEFVGRLQKVGLAGLGLGSVTIPVPMMVETPDGRRVMVWAARDLPGSGPSRVAVFPNAHPFALGARPLPGANWRRAE